MEEPLFDPSLKKRKGKKTVAFFEDPLGPEADPTTPAPLNGSDAPTVHEQMVKNGIGAGDEAVTKDTEEEDFKAMFGDVKKKKKKKKEIPLDLVCLFVIWTRSILIILIGRNIRHINTYHYTRYRHRIDRASCRCYTRRS